MENGSEGKPCPPIMHSPFSILHYAVCILVLLLGTTLLPPVVVWMTGRPLLGLLTMGWVWVVGVTVIPAMMRGRPPRIGGTAQAMTVLTWALRGTEAP